MPALPSEPEKYSIDEMMDRLKTSPTEGAEEGQLVTRADGSQSIRVRKRKRRSSQPQKEEQKRSRKARMIQVSAALILVLGAALAVGTGIVYANSSPFREALVEKIARTSGAAVELEQFRMTPQSANSNKLALKWPEGNVIRDLSLRGLTAEIHPISFLGNAMTGREVGIAEGTLSLQLPTPGAALRNIQADDAKDANLRFERYRIPLFHATVGNPAAPLIRLSRSEASLNPSGINGRPQLTLYRGDVNIVGWPEFQVDRALLEFRGSQTDIIGIRLLQDQDDRGALELAGTIYPYQPERLSTLAVKLDSLELASIAGPEMGRFFSGRIESLSAAESNFLSFRSNADPSPVLDLTFRVTPTSKLVMQGFPFLFSLSRMLDDDWFERPAFEADAEAVFRNESGARSLRDLNFMSKGRMALTGNVMIAPDLTLTGDLKVGIAEAIIASMKDPRLDSVFPDSADGFRWITLKISGSTTAPADNFKDILAAAAAAPKTEPAASAAGAGSTFEELTRPR